MSTYNTFFVVSQQFDRAIKRRKQAAVTWVRLVAFSQYAAIVLGVLLVVTRILSSTGVLAFLLLFFSATFYFRYLLLVSSVDFAQLRSPNYRSSLKEFIFLSASCLILAGVVLGLFGVDLSSVVVSAITAISFFVAVVIPYSNHQKWLRQNHH